MLYLSTSTNKKITLLVATKKEHLKNACPKAHNLMILSIIKFTSVSLIFDRKWYRISIALQ